MSPPPRLVLVTVSGKDQPGITSELTGILARHPVRIVDIAQAVIHSLLSLSILFDAGASTQSAESTLESLREGAARLGLALEHRHVEDAAASGGGSVSGQTHHYAVTLIADCVSARALHAVTAALAGWRLNIDSVKRLSEAEFGCVEMVVSTSAELDAREVRKRLLEIAKDQGVDIAFQAEGLYRRAKRLIVLDMDSTLIQAEVIDELAREHGVFGEVSAVTHEAMAGRMDYDESLRRRVALLKGLSAASLEKVHSRIQLTPGAPELIRGLKKLGYKVALISGGFTFVADRLRERLGIDFAYANTLDVRDGKVTGNVIPPIVNAQRKADLLDVIAQQERIELDQVIAVGDGANDLLMLERAGLGIAFNAKPSVRERADLSLSQRSLQSILYLLGMSARDVARLLL